VATQTEGKLSRQLEEIHVIAETLRSSPQLSETDRAELLAIVADLGEIARRLDTRI
jgi:hypothetical protein